MLHIAERRKALIGFAGPRVIQNTMRQSLPPGFQRSEFLMSHGVRRRHRAPSGIEATIALALRWWERRRDDP